MNAPTAQLVNAEQYAAWLAAISTAGSASSVHVLASRAALQMTGAARAIVFRPDDRGLLCVAESIPVAAPIDLTLIVASSLHRHWIVAHGSRSTDFAPFHPSERPDLLIAPLMIGDRLIGGLATVHAGDVPAHASERLAAIATIAAQAIEMLTLRQRLDLALTAADVEIELSKGRKAIARELHDGPAQELALAGYAIDRISSEFSPAHRSHRDAREAREFIDRAIFSIRGVIGAARTPRPAAPSLTGPLRDLLSEIDPPAPHVNVRFEDVSGLQLVPEVERAMVGIVREALHNVRKHAQAESVRLDVRRVDDEIEVSVTDDGIGISRDAAQGHFGLEHIRELAEETGGRIEIGRTIVNGTSVRAWIPLAGTDQTQASSSSLTRAMAQGRPSHDSLVPLEACLER